MKLNLGCGRFHQAGFVNVDSDPAAVPDVLHDLNVQPYPFGDGSADEIVATHVLEHLEDPFSAVAEWTRILASGGRLVVRVPHFSRGFTHPEHRRGFDVTLPSYFDPNFAGGYCGTQLECESLRLHWFGQFWLKRTVLPHWQFVVAGLFGHVVDSLANLSPYFASRLWVFWIGGFDEIEIVFRKPGDAPTGAGRPMDRDMARV
jgi:SAM-dependent methyltransferase